MNSMNSIKNIKKYSLHIHIVLCLLSASLAWQAAKTDPKKTDTATITLLGDGKSATNLKRVVYTWPKPEAGAAGDYTLTVTPLALHSANSNTNPNTNPNINSSNSEMWAGEMEGKAPFLLSKVAANALGKLAPLAARRKIGNRTSLDQNRLQSMGMDDPHRTVLVNLSGQEMTLLVGDSNYGGQGRYGQIKGQDDIYLFDAMTFSALEQPLDRLIDKRLVRAEIEDITAMRLDRTNNSAVIFQHEARTDGKARHFVDATGAKRDEAMHFLTLLRSAPVAGYIPLSSSNPNEDLAGATLVAQYAVESSPDTNTVVESGKIMQRADGAYFVVNNTWNKSAMLLAESASKEMLDDLNVLVP